MGQLTSNFQDHSIEQPEDESQPTIDIKALIHGKINSKYPLKDPQTYHLLFDTVIKDPVFDRALGCLFGSFMGDALGAYCEFSPDINENVIKKVMKMPGGGTYALKPGQFTDDSEMASHLTLGLLNFDPKKQLTQQIWELTRSIALQYMRWIKGGPFDVGLTCRKGILRLMHHKKDIQSRAPSELPAAFQNIYQQVLGDNKESESNGSLMRIAPMALFFTFLRQNPVPYKQLIENQIKLIHPKPILQAAGYVWVNALYKVINRKDNSPDTFKAIYQQLQSLEGSEQVKEWFQESKKTHLMNGKLNIGWAKIAWTYGMKILYNLGNQANIELTDTYYKQIIKNVISEAGDTDTNAAIVGGMMGALIGFNNLPTNYLAKMIKLKFQSNEILPQQARPPEYEPFEVLLKCLELLQKCQLYNTTHNNIQP